ncbi:MAG: hypothetical protein RsTaC01_0124 [Candidatus Paraimprobicoccus trichonymphae]|uniref:Uncharacterized protein n=1 Tax=Candidatus Paraimprobicoccus trichonymphae TaxID=3033793 RepID=A0AA48KXH5_9FIRM|nr:MAG: hypothetical protein RsTaC01_0124 [Candidatus Paraimprobicoccus trichonymphae]
MPGGVNSIIKRINGDLSEEIKPLKEIIKSIDGYLLNIDRVSIVRNGKVLKNYKSNISSATEVINELLAYAHTRIVKRTNPPEDLEYFEKKFKAKEITPDKIVEAMI